MATKAQRYSAEQEQQSSRSKAKKKTAKTRKKKDDPTVGPAVAGVTGAGKARRNFSKRSDNKGGPALEVSDAKTPSRKSTRSSAGRVKSASNLSRRETRKVHSPKERAVRASVR